MLVQADANDLLMNEFEEARIAFDEDDVGYCVGTTHCFYFETFVPLVISYLNEKREEELKKAFVFIERLFTDGDEYIKNLADVSIVESLYYEPDYEKYKEKIFSLCGVLTRKSFEDMERDE